MAMCAGVCFTQPQAYGQTVTLGTWLEEGTGTVTGAGNSFTATPTAIATADDGDNFAVRNPERHRVYQTFPAMDFATAGDEVHVTFDVTFSGDPGNLDSDFRMSLVDTSTNQGFYPLSFDTGTRGGTYNRIRFVDNLDGPNAEMHGGVWGGAFTDAINGSGTIAQSGVAPTLENGATDDGLTDGNRVTFSVVMTRDSGNSFSFTTNVTEKNGFVVYPEVSGSFDAVAGDGPGDGDDSIAGIAINSFDGIVFGIFDDTPFADSPGGSYTVSNICISDEPTGVVLLTEDFDYPNGDLAGNATWVGYGSDQSGPVQVENGQAVLTRPPGVQDVNRPFAGADGTLYYSLEFSVDDLGAPYPLDDSPDFEYFSTFYAPRPGGGDDLTARIDIQAPTGSGDFTVGIASDDGTADATWATDLNFDTVYRAVVSYDQDNNLAELWIDPVVESDTRITGTFGGGNEEGFQVGDTITAVALRQANSDGSEVVRVDNLMVGTSFKSVVPAPVATALAGDFDGNNIVNCDDLDGYVNNLGQLAAGALAQLDLNGNGTLEAGDADTVLTTLVETSNGGVGTSPGDLNCDGVVNVLGDALLLVTNLNSSVTRYGQGDLNFDGTVNVLGDALILVTNLGNTNQ